MSKILIVSKGHPFEAAPFFEMFDALHDVEWDHLEHPHARAAFEPEVAAGYDAFVFYDMPGIRFEPGSPQYDPPPERFKTNFAALGDRGTGLIFLHHAIAAWPAWPEYAEIIGGRFLYTPQAVRGEPRQDSGYRHGVTHTVSVLGDHPVTFGLPDQFQITDELYLFEVFEDDVQPLLASDFEFVADNFYSAAKVVLDGKMYDNEGWSHRAGSNLIGWTKRYRASPVVYLQCGDDPVAYANPYFRRLLGNAVEWVSKR